MEKSKKERIEKLNEKTKSKSFRFITNHLL